VRVHLPDWDGGGPDQVEARLRWVPGVAAVEANPLTRNVLIRFDPCMTDAPSLLAALQPPQPAPPEARGLSASPLLRAGVRGMLGHAAVDALWFGAGFLGKSFGLPLSALGPLHLLLDVVVWGAALASANGGARPAPAGALSGRGAA
jgi:hypothetical protein